MKTGLLGFLVLLVSTSTSLAASRCELAIEDALLAHERTAVYYTDVVVTEFLTGKSESTLMPDGTETPTERIQRLTETAKAMKQEAFAICAQAAE